ncbi:MAG: hypothetical protein IBX62_05810 [Coriobacteriia bacterium]|nr:hypothetical protein [Coriobacteriia bacterium]
MTFEDPRVEHSYTRARAACAAVAAVLPLLLLVSWLSDPAPRPPDPLTVLVMGAAGLSPLVSAPLVTTMMLAHAARPSSEGGTSAGEAGDQLFTISVVRCTLWELPLLLGFVLYAMYGSLALYAPFVLVSAAGLAAYQPRRALWETWLAAIERGRPGVSRPVS